MTIGELREEIEAALKLHGPQTMNGLFLHVKRLGITHFDFVSIVGRMTRAERIKIDGAGLVFLVQDSSEND